MIGSAKFSNQALGCKGVSLLELALLLPVIVALIAGLVDFGFKMNAVKQVADAARHAARISASHSRRVILESSDHLSAYCSLPDDPSAPVEGSCSKEANQNLTASDSIAAAGHKAACAAIITAGLTPEQWQVKAQVESRNEDGFAFQSVTVDISRIGEDCFICYDKIYQAFQARSSSEFVLEEKCQ